MSLKDDFAKLPWIGQLAIFVVIALAVIAIGYYFFITKIETKIAQNKAELSSLQIEIQKGRESKARTEQFKQELNRIEIQLEFLKKILPEKEELADLYTKIQERASHFGLQVVLFKPGAAAEKEFYTEYPIDVNLNSEYHSLAKFFEENRAFAENCEYYHNGTPKQAGKRKTGIYSDSKNYCFHIYLQGEQGKGVML